MGTKRTASAVSCVGGSSGLATPLPQAASDPLEPVAPRSPRSDDETQEPRCKRPRIDIESLLFGPPAPTSLSDLPEALLAEILRAVSSKQEPGKGYCAALVSKKWLRLSPEAQQSVRVRDGALLDIDSLLSQIRPFSSLTSLELGFCSVDCLNDAALARVAAAWPGLESLTVNEMAAFLRCEMTQAGINALATRCPRLRHLSLRQQSESPLTMPASFVHLQELQTLRLGNKHSSLLTSLPDSLGELRSLTELDIRSQGLESLPVSLGNLSNLTCLVVESRGLTILPSTLGNLISLVTLRLQCRRLHRLPDSIGDLRCLKRLHVSASVQEIPRTLGALSQLTRLDISSCYQLNTLPESLEHLKQLRSLGIGPGLHSYNSVLTNFRLLKYLHLSNFRGRILPSLKDLTHLKALSISFCDALTSLPDCLGSLEKLAKLTIKQCPLLMGLPAALSRIPFVCRDDQGFFVKDCKNDPEP